MIRFKESELKKTSEEYWILHSIKNDLLTFSNPIMYQGYMIYHSGWVGFGEFTFVHTDYDGAEDANDHRCGGGESIEDCINQINEYILTYETI